MFSAWDLKWEKSCAYAELEYTTVKHTRKRRGQSNKKRIIHQSSVGKFGEILASEYLAFLGYECTEPDFEVYTSKKKSWESDLFVGNTKIACKTQDVASAAKYGLSWIFQKSGFGKGHSDPVLNDDSSLSIFVWVDLQKRLFGVKGPFRLCDIRKYFKEPRVSSLRFSKVALYWEDIKDTPTYKIDKIDE